MRLAARDHAIAVCRFGGAPIQRQRFAKLSFYQALSHSSPPGIAGAPGIEANLCLHKSVFVQSATWRPPHTLPPDFARVAGTRSTLACVPSAGATCLPS